MLAPGDPFPDPRLAWDETTPAPGLLAAGGKLDGPTLLQAYRQGIFPWFNPDQLPLWWCTHPRMVLRVDAFKGSASLRKQMKSLARQGRLDFRVDHDFERIMRACSATPREGQSGSWIHGPMFGAYAELHRMGHAHCMETWIDGELSGGLYFVNIGRMVYGESMFSWVSNASKMSLARLVWACRALDMPVIDCQQQTTHLASMGAQPIDREVFLRTIGELTAGPTPDWLSLEPNGPI